MSVLTREDGSRGDQENEADGVPAVLRIVAGSAAHAAALLLQLAAALIVINAVYRYSLGGGFYFISEVTRFILLVVVFLGLTGTHLAGGHVRVELLLGILPPQPRRILTGYVVPVASIFFLVLIGYAGAVATLDMFESGTTTPSRPAVLMWPIIAVVPIGSGLLILLLLVGLARQIIGGRPSPRKGDRR